MIFRDQVCLTRGMDYPHVFGADNHTGLTESKGARGPPVLFI